MKKGFFQQMYKSSRTLRVALCQYNVQFKNVQHNRNRVEELLKNTQPNGFDVLVFPEMSLTGYMFEDKQDVFPFCEEQGKGEYFDFCLNLAKSFNCAVCCGYPEKEALVQSNTLNTLENYSLYNSMYFISPDGSFVNYRKHFLYETDMRWCSEGEGFKAIHFSLDSKTIVDQSSESTVKLGLGICMDINNGTDYTTKYSAKEFANFHKTNGSEVVLFIANWLASEEPKKCITTQSYWVERLSPMISHSCPYFVACNRVGTEKDILFAGGSCVIGLDKQQPFILESFACDDEGIKVIHLDL